MICYKYTTRYKMVNFNTQDINILLKTYHLPCPDRLIPIPYHNRTAPAATTPAW